MTGGLFDALPSVDEEANIRLHARLAAAAERDGVLDVAYRTVDSPVGELLLAATGEGLVRVAYDTQGMDEVLAALAASVSPRILRAPGRLDPVSRQLDEYFTGHRTTFDLPLDLRLATGFRKAVLAHLPHIAYGRTESYAEVAMAAGSPKAVRAVGTACARNPLPLVLPCHRVVKSDGSFGEYAGGADVKRILLTMEASA
ncbi:MAG TPA: methylated-DNA--[protein]-cysteine S-methyltransferase [Pseudonocardiaceae bacterium]|nr:methylated-DNA--[protein]-cysteine S-methyltransferase [Pseudonocardiaceae bacterium]